MYKKKHENTKETPRSYYTKEFIVVSLRVVFSREVYFELK